jgi:prolyl oligopeptidase
MPLALNPPPATPIESVTDFLHGVAVTDPYRWLEDQNSPRTRKWLEEQNAYARGYFDANPASARIRERVSELLTVENVSEPWKVGDRYLFLKRKAHQQQPVIMLRDHEFGEEIVLVDPALKGEGSTVSVNIVNISRDGQILAYGVKRSGADSQSVEFINIPHRQLLPDRLPFGFGPALVFSSGGDGFYYTHEAVNSAHAHKRAVYWHAFGSGSKEDLEVFSAGQSSSHQLGLFGSSDSLVLACLVVTSHDPLIFDLYLRDLTRDKQFRKVLDGVDSILGVRFSGHNLIALTDLKAPNLRLVSIDVDHPGSADWADIIPENQKRIKDFAVVRNSVCVLYEERYRNQIEVFDLAGQRRDVFLCPELGTIRLLQGRAESDTLFYNFSSFDQPRTIFSYCLSSGEHRVWAKNQAAFNSSSVEIQETSYKSKDGTDVPMFLVAHKDRGRSDSLPVFLTAYGGFGATITPQFSAFSVFLLEHGFLLAIANVRGGGELGEAWHRAGQRHNRQIAIDDFIAAAEYLVARGDAIVGHLAIGGGSNAGLLIGAALTQRPHIFRAALCIGPLLDMVRYHLFDSADAFIREYGSANNREDFEHLLAYSPYHRVQDGMAYPAVMIVSGDSDTRCNPMHARKMTARLQAGTISGYPILLHYKPEWGHVPMLPLEERIDALTDRLAFMCKELNVKV